jgi:hypothetical protein
MGLKRRMFVAAAAVAALAGCPFDDEAAESTSSPPDRAAGPADGDGGRNSRTATEDPEQRRVGGDVDPTYRIANHVYPSTGADFRARVAGASPGDVVHVRDGLTVERTVRVTTPGVAIVGGTGTAEGFREAGVVLESAITDGGHVIEFDSQGRAFAPFYLAGFAIAGNGGEGDGVHFVSRDTLAGEYSSGVVANVHVGGVGGHGFAVADAFDCEFRNVRAQRCGRDGGGNGIRVQLDQTQGLVFRHAWAAENGRAPDPQIREVSTDGTPGHSMRWLQPTVDCKDAAENDTVGMELIGGQGCWVVDPKMELGTVAIRVTNDPVSTGRAEYHVRRGRLFLDPNVGVESRGAGRVSVDAVSMTTADADVVLRRDVDGQQTTTARIGLPRRGYADTYDVDRANAYSVVPRGRLVSTRSVRAAPSGDVSGRRLDVRESGSFVWDGIQWRPATPVRESYTGDGTADRTVPTGFRPRRYVLVHAPAAGETFDLWDGAHRGVVASAPSGKLGWSDAGPGGLLVGANGGRAHPNADGVEYVFWAH